MTADEGQPTRGRGRPAGSLSKLHIPCERCGAHTQTYGSPTATKGLAGTRIHRNRRCGSCGHLTPTVEAVVPDPAGLRRLERGLLETALKEMEDNGDPVAPLIRDLFRHGAVKG